MKFQIREVVLWPRNESFPPRRLKLHLGTVNVITGSSKTGKSAVIPIIDYCLGSDQCSIPVSTIRDACSWFGVVVSTDEGDLLLARREPGSQLSTGDMFVMEGTSIELPQTIGDKNDTVDSVKRRLDRLAGLSNLSFDPKDAPKAFKSRPAFRDLVAFMFQPQNVVANPDVLFYKADTFKHREKLKTIFPYVLGSMTPELLAKKWEEDRVEAELRQKERELQATLQATERWKAELQTWASSALDVGLVTNDEYEDASGEAELVSLLKLAASRTSQQAELTEKAVEKSSREAAELDREEAAISSDLAGVRTRMERIQRLRASVDDYTGALSKQRDRLSLSRWLRERVSHDARCPICGGKTEAVSNELDCLCDALAEIEASSRQLSAVPAVFDKELIEVRQGVRELTERLQATRIQRRALEARSDELARARLKSSEVDRFLGRLEQALTMFEHMESDTAAREEVECLRAELAELREALSASGYRRRTKDALGRVSMFMSRVLPALDAERPNDPVELSIEDLTLRVKASSGRKDSLWEIGSGANWLAYHVALTLALQRLFMQQSDSPVPGLLAFDQPSQVYFPRKLARAFSAQENQHLEDEDLLAVRKVFEALGAAVDEAAGQLQVLVLDHAGSEVWGELPEVVLVEEWRHDKALVPNEWLS